MTLVRHGAALSPLGRAPRVPAREVVADPRRRVVVSAAGRQMVSTHWDECWFGIRALGDHDVFQHELPAAGGLFDDGGHEFAVVLAHRPLSSRVLFKVRSHGLRVYRQPDGSHAVYHASRAGNFEWPGGAVHYRAGKAFHILRPWAEDAAGARAWCDLRIPEGGNGVAVVVVPRWFLDDAVYPVLVDPTFGYTTIGGSTTAPGTELAHVGAATIYAASGGDTVTLLEMYGKSSGGSQSGSMSFYTANGTPTPVSRQIAGQTVTQTSSTTPTWATTSAISVALSGGTTYTTAFFVSGGGITAYYDTGAGDQASLGSAGGLPATWSEITRVSNIYSMYATYTTSGMPARPLIVPSPAVQRASNW